MVKQELLVRAGTKLKMVSFVLDDLDNDNYTFVKEVKQMLYDTTQLMLSCICEDHGIEYSISDCVGQLFVSCEELLKDFPKYPGLLDRIDVIDNWDNSYAEGKTSDGTYVKSVYGILCDFGSYISVKE